MRIAPARSILISKNRFISRNALLYALVRGNCNNLRRLLNQLRKKPGKYNIVCYQAYVICLHQVVDIDYFRGFKKSLLSQTTISKNHSMIFLWDRRLWNRNIKPRKSQ